MFPWTILQRWNVATFHYNLPFGELKDTPPYDQCLECIDYDAGLRSFDDSFVAGFGILHTSKAEVLTSKPLTAVPGTVPARTGSKAREAGRPLPTTVPRRGGLRFSIKAVCFESAVRAFGPS